MSRKDEVEAWYIANANNIKKWANKRSIQDAEDILQDTAIKLLTNKANWSQISRKDATRWTMYEYYKGQPIFESIEDEIVEDKTIDIIFNYKAISIINDCVEVLNGASKEIFKMHFFQDMGYDEIAKKLNMNHMSCKQLGSRAKKIVVSKFKELLDEN